MMTDSFIGLIITFIGPPFVMAPQTNIGKFEGLTTFLDNIIIWYLGFFRVMAPLDLRVLKV